MASVALRGVVNVVIRCGNVSRTQTRQTNAGDGIVAAEWKDYHPRIIDLLSSDIKLIPRVLMEPRLAVLVHQPGFVRLDDQSIH